jgi:hypothetical protein
MGKTWSLTIREEHRLRVSENTNRVLRRVFRPKRAEVAGGWRELHNEVLHNLYASTNIVRVNNPTTTSDPLSPSRTRNSIAQLFAPPSKKGSFKMTVT